MQLSGFCFRAIYFQVELTGTHIQNSATTYGFGGGGRISYRFLPYNSLGTVSACDSQKLLYPLIEEYSLNHIRGPTIT